MAKGPVLKPVFNAYQERQAMLLPPRLEELIAAVHTVRVVDEVLNFPVFYANRLKKQKPTEYLSC